MIQPRSFTFSRKNKKTWNPIVCALSNNELRISISDHESGDKSNLLIITILIYIHSNDECTFSHQLNLLTFAVADAKIIWKLPMAINKLATASSSYFWILYTEEDRFFYEIDTRKDEQRKIAVLLCLLAIFFERAGKKNQIWWASMKKKKHKIIWRCYSLETQINK